MDENPLEEEVLSTNMPEVLNIENVQAETSRSLQPLLVLLLLGLLQFNQINVHFDQTGSIPYNGSLT